MYKILIVEDDNTIAERLASHLKKWNYKTVCVRDFKNVMEEFKKTDPQLVILDIGLPFYNGFYWCQEIRKLSNVPIIFLSSMNDNMNIVMAMNMGGDEFIEKPFDLNVVTAKVQAVLRRAYALQGTANIIEHGEMLLNLGDASLTIAGQKIELTKNEFKICQMFFESAGKFVTRDAIMTRLWESDEFIDDNTLTVNVARLRKKLEEAGLVLAVFDLAAPLNEEDLEIARRCQGRPALAILNKQDLAGQGEAFTAAQQQLAPYFKAIIPLTARDAASLQPLCQAVAQLKYQSRSGEQLYTRTIDTADIDSIMISQPERSQFLPVQFRASDNNALGDQFTVNRIPVNVLFIPIRIFLFTKKYRQGQSVFFRSYHQQTVAFFQNLV